MIGKGAYATVYKCKNINTGIYYATKQISMNIMDDELCDVHIVEHEVKLLVDLIKCDNIIKLIDVCRD